MLVYGQSGEKGTLVHCWCECKLLQLLWKTVWRFFKILTIELPYDPAIPLLGINPEKTIIQKESCTTMFMVLSLCLQLFDNLKLFPNNVFSNSKVLNHIWAQENNCLSN